MRYLILALLFTFNSGCATYFLKKKCESTNWFAYGEQTAMDGKRLDEDSFVQSCRKAEAPMNESLLDRGFKKGQEAYCKPEVAFQTGKAGKFFIESMCQGLNMTETKKQHQAGVAQFCQPVNAERFGQSGSSYNNICPDSLEKDFLASYNKGRKFYLRGEVTKRKSQIDAKNLAIKNLQIEKSRKEGELRGLTFAVAATNQVSPEAKEKREDLERQLSSIDYKERDLQGDIGNLNSEIGKMEAEITSLGE